MGIDGRCHCGAVNAATASETCGLIVCSRGGKPRCVRLCRSVGIVDAEAAELDSRRKDRTNTFIAEIDSQSARSEDLNLLLPTWCRLYLSFRRSVSLFSDRPGAIGNKAAATVYNAWRAKSLCLTCETATKHAGFIGFDLAFGGILAAQLTASDQLERSLI